MDVKRQQQHSGMLRDFGSYTEHYWLEKDGLDPGTLESCCGHCLSPS